MRQYTCTFHGTKLCAKAVKNYNSIAKILQYINNVFIYIPIADHKNCGILTFSYPKLKLIIEK
jgi:hypothetical protein